MRCIKTGIVCVWNKNHCYSGDEFECPSCDNTTVSISGESFFDPNILKNKDVKTIDMEED